jgi:hypothetical protein
VIISIKGTSAGVLGSGGPTAKNDKFNDNLLFSCCCARVDFSWSPVCDCYAGGYKCEQTCLEDALVAESVYATVGTVSGGVSPRLCSSSWGSCRSCPLIRPEPVQQRDIHVPQRDHLAGWSFCEWAIVHSR